MLRKKGKQNKTIQNKNSHTAYENGLSCMYRVYELTLNLMYCCAANEFSLLWSQVGLLYFINMYVFVYACKHKRLTRYSSNLVFLASWKKKNNWYFINFFFHENWSIHHIRTSTHLMCFYACVAYAMHCTFWYNTDEICPIFDYLTLELLGHWHCELKTNMRMLHGKGLIGCLTTVLSWWNLH